MEFMGMICLASVVFASEAIAVPVVVFGFLFLVGWAIHKLLDPLFKSAPKPVNPRKEEPSLDLKPVGKLIWRFVVWFSTGWTSPANEHARKARKKYEERVRLLEKAGLEEFELRSAMDKAKNQYLRELDGVFDDAKRDDSQCAGDRGTGQR
jgi:hypothetical protein